MTQVLIDKVMQVIADKKGCNILALDVRQSSTMTDFFVIAEGMARRHVIGIAKGVIDELHKEGLSPSHVEGIKEGDWVVIDYRDFVVHLLTEQFQEHYRLSQVWNRAIVIEKGALNGT